MFRDSLGYTDGEVLGSDVAIKLGYTYGKVLVTILGSVDGIKLVIDDGTYIGSFYGLFDGSNHGKLESVLPGDSIWFTDGKVIGSDKVSKLSLFDGKVIATILGNVDEVTIALDVGTELGSLYRSFDYSNDGKFGGLFFKVHWDLMMDKCMDLMKVSN